MNGSDGDLPAAWREAAAGLLQQREAVARGDALDLDGFDRSIRQLERLLRISGDAGAPAADRLLLLDEAVKLRDSLVRELARTRGAMDQDRRHRRAAHLYRRSGA